MRSFYEVLGVDRFASTDEIKAAYRAAVKPGGPCQHPDHVRDVSPEERKAAEDRFKEATTAYAVLGDEERRSQYDRGDAADVVNVVSFVGDLVKEATEAYTAAGEEGDPFSERLFRAGKRGAEAFFEQAKTQEGQAKIRETLAGAWQGWQQLTRR